MSLEKRIEENKVAAIGHLKAAMELIKEDDYDEAARIIRCAHSRTLRAAEKYWKAWLQEESRLDRGGGQDG